MAEESQWPALILPGFILEQQLQTLVTKKLALDLDLGQGSPSFAPPTGDQAPEAPTTDRAAVSTKLAGEEKRCTPQ
ncbi:hypothetical protein FOXB_06624 [Fusarium oxysporum f. sp. conglutinans Fo5176]|uniref:Uncharacterized protein n=1 Tax=Fusarium oxysporum (strain Fo5176) TaxID=660025 RepID=F9FJT8_FUSOF|nr:hypothetical protein FOXB_06624 [Fusarium oxysporum f. sp. conglutinans Fo5176]